MHILKLLSTYTAVYFFKQQSTDSLKPMSRKAVFIKIERKEENITML